MEVHSSKGSGAEPTLPCLLVERAAPALPSLGARLAPGAAGWPGQLCYCQGFVTLLLSNSCFMWQMTHRNTNVVCSLCLKILLWANTMLSCVYIVLLILVYVKLMKVRLITAAWNWLTHMGLAVLPGMERQNSVIPFLGFFSHRIFTHILSVLVGGFCHEAGQILTRLSRKVVSSPSLEILRTWLDKILSNLLCFGPSLRRELEYMKCLST